MAKRLNSGLALVKKGWARVRERIDTVVRENSTTTGAEASDEEKHRRWRWYVVVWKPCVRVLERTKQIVLGERPSLFDDPNDDVDDSFAELKEKIERQQTELKLSRKRIKTMIPSNKNKDEEFSI